MQSVEDRVKPIVVIARVFWSLQVRKILHVKMFFIAASDDLVTPDEEDAGEDVGIFLKAGLEGDCAIDLVLLLTLLFHQKYLNPIRF